MKIYGALKDVKDVSWYLQTNARLRWEDDVGHIVSWDTIDAEDRETFIDSEVVIQLQVAAQDSMQDNGALSRQPGTARLNILLTHLGQRKTAAEVVALTQPLVAEYMALRKSITDRHATADEEASDIDLRDCKHPEPLPALHDEAMVHRF